MENSIDRNEIKAKVQLILNKAHTLPQKKVIVENKFVTENELTKIRRRESQEIAEQVS